MAGWDLIPLAAEWFYAELAITVIAPRTFSKNIASEQAKKIGIHYRITEFDKKKVATISIFCIIFVGFVTSFGIGYVIIRIRIKIKSCAS